MNLIKEHCKPCEGNAPPLPDAEETFLFNELKKWKISRDGIHKISREFTFKDFPDAVGFVNRVAVVAETEGHHPDIQIHYNKVVIELFTHAILGLSRNDFIVAAKVDKLVN